VKEQQAGLASGLLNTRQQLGGAIGIAIAASVAASHTLPAIFAPVRREAVSTAAAKTSVRDPQPALAATS